MFRNHLKIAWRNIQRSKVSSIINVYGFSLGMAASILMLIWIQFELSFDRFYPESDRIVSVWRTTEWNDEVVSWNYTPGPYGPALKNQIPEIEAVTRLTEWEPQLLKVGTATYYEETTFVEPDFFKIFQLKALSGNPVEALQDPESIVLTEELAIKLFGDEDPIGKTVTVENQLDMEVKAVVENFPLNSTFRFTAFLPFGKLTQMGWVDDFWGNNSYLTFALLTESASLDQVNEKISDFTQRNSSITKVSDFLFPFQDLHLYSKFENGESGGGRIELVRIFGAVSIVILFIAGINFVNLSTAQSDRRAKEVGIRKLSGAGRGSLISQFLAESVLMATASFLLAILLISLFFPTFRNLVGYELESPFVSPLFWGFSILFILIVGILAGSYPAFLMSSFAPVKAMKSQFNLKKGLGVRPREVLVIFQFAVVVTLLSSVWIIRDQVNYVQNRDLGMVKDRLIYHPVTRSIRSNKQALRNELLNLPSVASVTYTFSPLTEIQSDTDGMEWQGKDPESRPLISRMGADANLVETAGLKLIAGRDLDCYTYFQDSSAVVINEKTASLLGFEDPIGQDLYDDGKKFTIVGVVKDFIMNSPFDEAVPIAIFGPKKNQNYIHIRYKEGEDLKNLLAETEAIFAKFNPDSPFEYHFVDTEHARKFESQERISKLTTLFTGLAIFISCMGLFGLAAFIAERKSKEISIRKVLGANLPHIIKLISAEFTKLVAVSVLIGIPLAWYFMSDWLNTFEYRTQMNTWIFLWTGVLTLLIALLTVSSHAIKAAFVNPAKILKSE